MAMKLIKSSVLKFSNLMIAGILSLLGFGFSCESKDEYGSPSADYKVIGNVVSSENETAISNLKVVLTELYYEIGNAGDTTIYENQSEVAYTASDGSYEVQFNTYPDEQKDFKLTIADVDGDDNGSFASKDTTITFNDNELSGGSGWYSGMATKTIDLKLDKN